MISTILHRLNKVKWWFLHRIHPMHRYHVINTGLGYGWRDRDVVMEAVLVKPLVTEVFRNDHDTSL